jgi:hypothetical protein
MKTALATAFLLVMVVQARAVTTASQAFTTFTDENGNVGVVSVARQLDPFTHATTTTTVTYSFCVQTTAASCLEGSGTVPNDAFTGNLTSSVGKADVLKLHADTTIPGFVNELCIAPDPFGGCEGGISPATGGLISLAFTKKRGDIEVFTSGDFRRENFKITLDSVSTISQFPGKVQGTVIGTNVSTDASMAFDTETGKGTPATHSLLERSVTPQTLRRLQRLTGNKL